MADVIEGDIDDLTRFRKIGSGGFATVYAAWDEGFQRWVAVKVLPTLDAEGRRRFDRERALMGTLDTHPHVVTPYRSGYTADGDAFLVMEYLPGGSLQDLLDARGSIELADAVRYLVPISGAVDAGHRRGILHHDIKPGNILLTADDVPKLTDFGISGTRDATTTLAAFTLAHAPPESFADGYDRQDERSDFYSLASTLYTLIAGHSPFEVDGHDSSQAQLMRILTRDPPPLGHRHADEFFAVGLAKRPEARFQSGAELALAMRALATGAPATTVVPPISAPPAPRSVVASVGPGIAPVPAARLDGRPHNDLDDLADLPLVAPRSTGRSLLAVAAAVGFVVLATSWFALRSSADDQPDAFREPEPSFAPIPATVPPTVVTTEGPIDTITGVTAPGPGSFSVGQLKLGLLATDALPTGWTVEGDATTQELAMDLPCNGRFEWADDQTSPQVVGAYRGPAGEAAEHQVWSLDVWIAEDLFVRAATDSGACTEPWRPASSDGAADGDLELVTIPAVASFGHETIVYTATAASVDDAERTTTVLTRCDGLVSRLVVTSPPALAGTPDPAPGELAAAAYENLVVVAEWENATCPPGP